MIEYHIQIVVLDRKKSDAIAANRLAYFLYALAALQLLITAMFAYFARSYTYKCEYDDDDGSLSDVINETHPFLDQDTSDSDDYDWNTGEELKFCATSSHSETGSRVHS